MQADKAHEQEVLDENAKAIAEQDQELLANEVMQKVDEENAMNEAVDAVERARREAEEAKKYVNIPEPPFDEKDEICYGTLAAPEGCQPAYCPALNAGRILTGRDGAPVPPPPSQA